MTRLSDFPLRAGRDGDACGNNTTVHNASLPAARYKTAAVSREETLVHAAGGVSSAATFIAALRI